MFLFNVEIFKIRDNRIFFWRVKGYLIYFLLLFCWFMSGIKGEKFLFILVNRNLFFLGFGVIVVLLFVSFWYSVWV